MKNKTKTIWTIATAQQSREMSDDTIPRNEIENLSMPDGNPDAIRLMIGSDGQPLRHKDGSLQYCAPWLLSSIFR